MNDSTNPFLGSFHFPKIAMNFTGGPIWIVWNNLRQVATWALRVKMKRHSGTIFSTRNCSISDQGKIESDFSSFTVVPMCVLGGGVTTVGILWGFIFQQKSDFIEGVKQDTFESSICALVRCPCHAQSSFLRKR
jgi:hypothetical protein